MMKRFSFLNCASSKGKHRGEQNTKNCKNHDDVDSSINESNPSSTGDCSSINKCAQNGSLNDNQTIITVSRHNRLDAKPKGFVNDNMGNSKTNLFPSDSCSILMKQSTDNVFSAEHSDIYKRLEVVVGRLERLLNTNDLMADDHSGIINFRKILNEDLACFVEISTNIGGPAAEQAILIRDAFNLTLDVMQLARKYCKPSVPEMSKLLRPISFKLYEIAEIASNNRSHELHQALSTISDSVSILSWINMSCSAVFVKDVENATRVSANATTQTYRESMPVYAEWMRAWLRVVSGVRAVVCELYPVGLVWQSPSAHTPPPPPPPPPPAQTDFPVSPKGVTFTTGTENTASRREWRRQDTGREFNREALLRDISRRGQSGLRHVDGFSYDA